MASTDIFVAKETFTTNLDGQPVMVSKGQTRVRAGHPLLKGREMYFEPLTVQYDVEKATNAPGEVRGAPAPATDRTEALKAATRAANAAKADAEKAASDKAAADKAAADTGDNGPSADSK